MVIEMDFDLDHNHFFVVLFGSKAPLKIFPRIVWMTKASVLKPVDGFGNPSTS
jgi:hypothetical protein